MNMKRSLSFILSALLILSCVVILQPVPVLAADDEEEETSSLDRLPDDAFEGEYAEFKGSDGSKTEVYDNGSVFTTYADGSKEGVDYLGNQYTKSKDGTYTVRGSDGYSATEYPDGRQSMTEPGGKTTTVYKDGHMTEEYSSFGLTVEYNKDGETTGIGFTGSSERIGYDEDGCMKQGTVSGPNGATLTVTEDGMSMTAPNGKTAEYTYSGNKETTRLTAPDGSSAWNEITTSWNTGEDGKWYKTESSNAGIIAPDGSRFDSNFTLTSDENGDPVSVDKYVGQWTNEDGSTLWMDGNSKAVEFYDPNTGDRFVTDPNGNLREMKGSDIDYTADYDENGNLTSANINYPDGANMTVNPDGSSSFTLPDGTQYTSDGQGNVWENGNQIKENGTWLVDPNASMDPDADKITASDLVGYWSINGTLGDMESPIVSMLTNFFDELFGEGSGSEIVDSHIDGTQELPLNAYIEEDGSGYRVTIYADETTMVYSGTLKKDTLKLKLVSQSSSGGDAIEIPVNKLELKFVKRRGVTTMNGSYRIDTALFKATLSYTGYRQ